MVIAACARRAALGAVIALTAVLAQPAYGCVGDCNGDGVVSVNEMVEGVGISLGLTPANACSAFDADGNGIVTVNELVTAVNALLNGCPETGTPTPTINESPIVPTPSIYRALPGFDIELPLNAVDPKGGPVRCSVSDLPAGATFDAQGGVLSWLPTADQLGPFYVPFTCMDDAVPPASAAGQLIFAVAARDSCATPTCAPAAGCTTALPPATQSCCAGGPAARVAEPVAGCPEGRVLYVGRNIETGFGRVQNCDILPLRNFQQTSAEAEFHIEARCLNTLNKVTVQGRMDSNSTSHPIVFNSQLPPLLLNRNGPNGFARAFNLRFNVSPPKPYFDLEGAEANLALTVTDSDGVSVSTEVRVVLSFTPPPDLPDLDATATPTPTASGG